MPRRTSSSTKKARGTYRPGRSKGPEIEPLTRVPPPPKNLPGGAVEHWRTLGKEGVRRRTLSSGDLPALAEAAKAAALIDSLHALLEAAGSTETAKDGSLRPAAAFREIRAWTAEYRSWLRQLGLTPAARPSVEPVRSSTPTTEFEKLIAAGGIKNG